MKILNSEVLCEKGNHTKEDIANIGSNSTWVLDGATGLNGRNIIASAESDAQWYVKWWDSFLLNNLDNMENSIQDILKEGIGQIRNEFNAHIGNEEITNIDFPSSTISITRWKDNILEYFTLGDGTIAIRKNCRTEVYRDNSIKILDDKVYERMKYLIDQKGQSLYEAKANAMDMLIDHRLKKNNSDGYWILEFDEKAIDNGLYGRIEVKDEVEIILTSDGFSAISDKYNRYPVEKLIEEARIHGLGKIYKEIRDIEIEDSRGEKYPRFKIHDDSSAVYIRLG
ncbi:protein phosphatase 2C domain-containing protein [Sporanaerobacter acetigenes]|uniref:Protein phosphatase 2C n=1 Tax=Sporanaerobacter acetigenes DSM 13106 TaxID=1123281 RepID=A0A1M5YAD2_9FIRM|nr:protein phosphatase 2C domain-containing protein [Sporanaerobacter acetigenes]SHI08926.1 Protein phosphatase 2C [Sporanaerobacter acetigenes DSM 13106]